MAKESLVLAIILALVATPMADAGCGHFFHHKVVAVPVVAAVPVAVYQVGTDLEIKAAVEKALRQERAFQAQQLEAQRNAYQQQQWNAERQPQALQTTSQPTGYQNRQNLASIAPTVYAKCGKCHAEANFSAGGHYDISKGLNAEQFFRITDMVANKTDVPSIMQPVMQSLKPDEYGKLLDELIKLKKATGNPVVSNSNSSGY